jgi:hypothetical protein
MIKRAIKRAMLRYLLNLAHKYLAEVPLPIVADAFRRADAVVIARALPKLREILGAQLTPADVALFDLIDAAVPPEARPN